MLYPYRALTTKTKDSRQSTDHRALIAVHCEQRAERQTTEVADKTRTQTTEHRTPTTSVLCVYRAQSTETRDHSQSTEATEH